MIDLHLVGRVRLAVAVRLLLPVGSLLLLGQEVAAFIRFRRHGGSRILRADCDSAGFGNGGVVVVAGDGCFIPTGFTPGRLPLRPLPLQRCLSLGCQQSSSLVEFKIALVYLELRTKFL